MNERKGQQNDEEEKCSEEYVQWTQNNYELRKRHSKRGKKKERARGSAMAKSLSEHVQYN
jgi:hypothetical protein